MSYILTWLWMTDINVIYKTCTTFQILLFKCNIQRGIILRQLLHFWCVTKDNNSQLNLAPLFVFFCPKAIKNKLLIKYINIALKCCKWQKYHPISIRSGILSICGWVTMHNFHGVVHWYNLYADSLPRHKSFPWKGTKPSLLSHRLGPFKTLRWRHNDLAGVSNHQPHGCLLNRLFRRRSNKTSKLRVTGLCVGNSPGPVNSPHKGPVTRKMFPFDDVIMILAALSQFISGWGPLGMIIKKFLVWSQFH